MTGQELDRVLRTPISDAVLHKYGWNRDAVERLLVKRVAALANNNTRKGN